MIPVGAVVTLRSGGLRMTVVGHHEDRVLCAWTENQTRFGFNSSPTQTGNSYPEACLMIVSEPPVAPAGDTGDDEATRLAHAEKTLEAARGTR